MTFTKGQVVIHHASGERGVIIEVHAPIRGRQLYTVHMNNGPKEHLGSTLIPDQDISDPFTRLSNGMFGNYLDFCRINTSFKLKNTSTNTISSLKASNTIFKPYQFKPLLKFLNSANRRLLIADEVGLGKTISAGHIMLELAARKELRNCLIVCPKSLAEKWQRELKDKFNFEFTIYSERTTFIKDLSIKGNKIKGIVTYDKLIDREINGSVHKNSLTEAIENNSINFDLSIFDEAHRLRNHTSKRHKGANLIAQNSSGVLFLTATPIMIDEANLFNLLKVLDASKYSDYSIFKNELELNKPFVHALNQLAGNTPFRVIRETLENTVVTLEIASGDEYRTIWHEERCVSDWFSSIPLYDRIIQQLKHSEENIPSKVQLQFDLSDMSEMNKVFSRTRKVEVTQDWSLAQRSPKTYFIEPLHHEISMLQKLESTYKEKNSISLENDPNTMRQGAILGLINLKRQLSSSIYAYANTMEDLRNGIDKFDSHRDSKFEKLVEIINEVCVRRNKKIIIFTTFKKTINYLALRLNKNNFRCALIDGETNERQSIIHAFQKDPDLHVLLSTEVGSEGLDMQFCDSMVNYDLPWNPMVIEQRIGRIDRLGQSSSILQIYNLVIAGSIQEEIYVRLLDRIEIFRTCIGDLEAILDKELELFGIPGKGSLRKYFAKLEEGIYREELTAEQVMAKSHQIEQAILRERKNLEEINEGLTNTLTNDIYFKNEVESITKNARYITEAELVHYVEMLITHKLTTCELVPIDKETMTYEFIIPKKSDRLLINFLTDYEPEHDETLADNRRFINSIRGLTKLTVTFSQEAGYKDHRLIRIHAYHPLILAANNFFSTRDASNHRSFSFSIDRNAFTSADIKPGRYMLGVYSTSFVRAMHRRKQKSEKLLPIVYDIERRRMLTNRNSSDEFLGISQRHPLAQSELNIPDEELILEIKYSFAEELESIALRDSEDQKMRLETFKKMQIQRHTELHNNKIEMHRKIIRQKEQYLSSFTDPREQKRIQGQIKTENKNILKEQERLENAIYEINECSIDFQSPNIISMNLVTVS